MFCLYKHNEIEIAYLKSKVAIMKEFCERNGFYIIWLEHKLRDKNACEKALYVRINALHKLFFDFYRFEAYTEFKFYKKSIEKGADTDFEKMTLLIDYFKSKGFTSI